MGLGAAKAAKGTSTGISMQSAGYYANSVILLAARSYLFEVFWFITTCLLTLQCDLIAWWIIEIPFQKVLTAELGAQPASATSSALRYGISWTDHMLPSLHSTFSHRVQPLSHVSQWLLWVILWPAAVFQQTPAQPPLLRPAFHRQPWPSPSWAHQPPGHYSWELPSSFRCPLMPLPIAALECSGSSE